MRSRIDDMRRDGCITCCAYGLFPKTMSREYTLGYFGEPDDHSKNDMVVILFEGARRYLFSVGIRTKGSGYFRIHASEKIECPNVNYVE